MDPVRIGDSAEILFELKLSDGSIPNLSGAKVWVGVKLRITEPDPPLILLRNSAAGGDESQAAVTSAAEGKFSGYLSPAHTSVLEHGHPYEYDGVVQLADGRVYTANVGRFKAAYRVTRTVG